LLGGAALVAALEMVLDEPYVSRIQLAIRIGMDK
jgi:hypothetical protein